QPRAADARGLGLDLRRPVDGHRPRPPAAREGRGRPHEADADPDRLGNRLPAGDSVTITWSDLASALLWSAVAGLATWFVLLPVRRRSLAGLLASLVLTGAAASAGALWGAIHAMLVTWADWKTMIVLTAFSGAV